LVWHSKIAHNINDCEQKITLTVTPSIKSVFIEIDNPPKAT